MPLSAVFRNRDVWFLCLAYFGGTSGEYGLSLWLPKILQRVGSLTAAKTALLTAIPSIVAIPVMLIVGWRSDKLGERRWHAATPLFVSGLALALTVAYRASLPASIALFIIADAAAEAAVGLGIIIAFFRNRETVQADEMDLLKW